MFMLSHPLRWLSLRLSGSRFSNSVLVRGAGNLAVGRGVKVGRQSELNAASGGIELADGVNLGAFSLLESRGGRISIGANTSVSPYCVMYGHGGLAIGSDCIVATGVTFIPANHIFDDPDRLTREQGETKKGIKIGDNVWIAAKATILDGVTIGDGAVIGAGAVVNRDVPAYAVAAGVPAKVLRDRRGS